MKHVIGNLTRQRDLIVESHLQEDTNGDTGVLSEGQGRTVDLGLLLWHNPANLKKAVMETSKLSCPRQRTRKWCEPGLGNELKILPEPQAERIQEAVLSRCAGLAARYPGRQIAKQN